MDTRVLATNKRAFFDYEILETLESGLVLTGQEVKSAKLGHISLIGAYVISRNGEAFLTNCRISPYEYAGLLSSYNPERSRKLLLHKNEIARLIGMSKQKGLTFIPIKVYIKHGWIKVEFAIAKGKKKFDKRQSIKKHDDDRNTERELKQSSNLKFSHGGV